MAIYQDYPDLITLRLLYDPVEDDLTRDRCIFINLAEEIHDQYPLVYLPAFTEDLTNPDRAYDSMLLKKYNIPQSRLERHVKIKMGFPGRPYKGTDANTKSSLSLPGWRESYYNLQPHYKHFYAELLQMYCYDFSLLIIFYHMIMDGRSMDFEEIFSDMARITTRALASLIENDRALQDHIKKYMDSLEEQDVRLLCMLLCDMRCLEETRQGHFTSVIKMGAIKGYIVSAIKAGSDGASYSAIHLQLLKTVPILRRVPVYPIIDKILRKLVKDDLAEIRINDEYSRPFSDRICWRKSAQGRARI